MAGVRQVLSQFHVRLYRGGLYFLAASHCVLYQHIFLLTSDIVRDDLPPKGTTRHDIVEHEIEIKPDAQLTP